MLRGGEVGKRRRRREMKGGGEEEEKEGNEGRWGRERAMFTKAEFQLTVDPST